MSEPHVDVVEEGRRLIRLAEQEKLPLRLLGGVAVRLRGPGPGHPAFERSIGERKRWYELPEEVAGGP
ncbi:MAG TPA: hypothetical protein VES61_02000 [Gaiellaceae bacterium]|nr:hypothetical protein [Gaiellaceae bacterium]